MTPTKAQLARIEGLGFTISDDARYSTNELDDILELVNLKPDTESLADLRDNGIQLSKNTALEARMALDLVVAYSTDSWEDELPRTALAAVCAIAMRDPLFYGAAIGDNNLGVGATFYWPESKLKEWVKGAGSLIAAWEKEVQLQSHNAHALVMLGNEYKRVGRLTDAIATYKQAINVAPKSDDPWIALAALYHHSGRFTEAESAFVEAQRASPKGFSGFVKALKRGPKYVELQQRYPEVFKE